MMGNKVISLILDDNDKSFDKLRQILKQGNYQVELAGCYQDGLDITSKEQIDLILLENELSGKNAFEVYENLKTKNSNRDIPVIFISSLNKAEQKARAFELGAVDYITKPFNENEIMARINRHLNIKEEKDKLKVKNEKQEILLENIETQIWYLKDPETYGPVNEAHADFLGFEKSEIEHKKISNFYSEEETEICIMGNKKVFQKKEKIETEELINNREGENRLFAVTKTPKINKNGEVEYVVCTALDITERKKQEEKLKKQKDRLNWIIEGTNSGTWELNLQTGEAFCNQKWAELLGYELEEIDLTTINNWKNLVHPDDLKKCKKAFKKHFRGEAESYNVEARMKHKAGHWIWMLGLGKVISWTDDGSPYKMFGIDIDISEQKKQEQIIKELHSATIGLQKLDSEKEICLKTIESAREILDFDLCHVSLLKNDQFVPTAASEIMETKTLPLDYGIAGKAFKNNESYLTLNTAKDPDAKPTEKKYKSGITIPMKDTGFFQAISTEINDFNQKDLELAEILIGSTKAALDKLYYQKELEYKSFHDSLTNLYNRRFFEEELHRLDTKRQLPISIIMADLNGLKLINDSYGHEKGDELLKKTAEILESSIRKEDIVARQGGDEFAVLLPKTDNEQLNKIIKRIKAEVKNANNKENIPISIALGSATKEDPAESINQVLKKADDNMYQNKLSESRSTKSKIVQGLLNSLSAKSNETQEHSLRMRNLALKFGNKLKLTYSELNRLSLLATMHDIGKTTIPENILTKPGQLTDKEWELVKKHSEKGYKIASASEELVLIAEDILSHHENWDGKGYPQGLKGEEIPYLARIISIVDAYDVMVNESSYNRAISAEKALEEIRKNSGSQFDPELADEFIELMTEVFSLSLE